MKYRGLFFLSSQLSPGDNLRFISTHLISEGTDHIITQKIDSFEDFHSLIVYLTLVL